jgi:heptosyltransferase I
MRSAAIIATRHTFRPVPTPADHPRRILIIRPSALGDVCRSVPVLASLRKAYPDAHIDWLVQDSFAPAIASHPALTGVIPFPRRHLSDSLKRYRLGPSLRFLNALRRNHYDLVYDFQGLARSGLFAFATRARRRFGFADARELGWLGTTRGHRLDADPARHTVDRMLDLVRFSGIEPIADMRLYPNETDRLKVLADPQIPTREYALIAPTSRWPGKQWPDDRFAAVARHCLKRGLRVVLVGARAERSQIPRCLDLPLQEKLVVDRVGATDIGELLALVQFSRLVIGNDSAVTHMAVGFNRPLIALYGPTRVDLVGPYKRDGDVIQHITPDDVLDHKQDLTGRRLMERITTDEVCLRIDALLLTEAEQI